MENKSNKIISILEIKTKGEEEEERLTNKNEETKGVKETIRMLEKMHHSSIRALSASLRLLDVCERNTVYKEALREDPYFSDLRNLLTGALCCMGEMTPQIQERIRLSIAHTYLLYDIREADLYPDELIY